MKNITKYQHIIPASYIAQFAQQQNQPLRDSNVFCYDARATKIFPTKAGNIGGKDWYFEINGSILEIEDKVNIVEKLLAGFEGKFCIIANKNTSFSELSIEDKNVILFYMLHLYLRTEKRRDEMVRKLNQEMDKKFIDSDAIVKHKNDLALKGKDPNFFDGINTSKGREIVANNLHSALVADAVLLGLGLGHKIPNPLCQNEVNIFSEYEYQFVRVQQKEWLISGDHPVIMNEFFVAFPISKEVCLLGHKKDKPGIEKLLQVMLTSHGINCFITENSRNIIYGPNETLLRRYIGLIPKM